MDPKQGRMSLSLFGLAALEHARQGMAVFPLRPKDKRPLTSDGFHSATTDPDTIRAWWTANPTANIGGVPASAGLVALDIDSPSCWSLAMSLGLLAEPTHRVTTGMSQPGAETAHLYFRHPAPPVDTKLGGVIIVRGARGYVVLPPSIHPVTGQAYVSDTTIADATYLPDRAAVLLMSSAAPSAASVRAADALAAPELTPGDRHDALLRVAGKLAAHGLVGEEGRALLHGFNATKCRPPKDADEVNSVWEYVSGREGGKRAAVQAVHDTIDLSALGTAPDPTPSPARTILRASELMLEPERIPFLIDNLLPANGLGVLWAAAGVGKTFTTLDLAMHVATGRTWQGRDVTRGTVLYCVGEGFAGMRSRVAAWCAEHAIEPAALDANFLVRRVAWDFTNEAGRQAVRDELATLGAAPALIVIDTLSANAPGGFEESKTQHMKALMDAARVIRDDYPATVLFVHHTGIEDTRLRGSSDLIGAVDVSLHLRTAGKGGERVLVTAKARDFAPLDPVPLLLVADHGAQVVRSGDPVDLSGLNSDKPAHVRFLTALADAGRPMRGKELTGLDGMGNYAYVVRDECQAAQYIMAVNGAWILTAAGNDIVKRHRPAPADHALALHKAPA
jgi:hypothetical protein